MGHGGPEERANKQVAEGGRGETLIPCCARPLIRVTKTRVQASPRSASNSLPAGSTRRIKKHPPRIEGVQVILLSNHLFFDVAFFTGSRTNTPHCTVEGCGSGKHGCPFPPHTIKA